MDCYETINTNGQWRTRTACVVVPRNHGLNSASWFKSIGDLCSWELGSSTEGIRRTAGRCTCKIFNWNRDISSNYEVLRVNRDKMVQEFEGDCMQTPPIVCLIRELGQVSNHTCCTSPSTIAPLFFKIPAPRYAVKSQFWSSPAARMPYPPYIWSKKKIWSIHLALTTTVPYPNHHFAS